MLHPSDGPDNSDSLADTAQNGTPERNGGKVSPRSGILLVPVHGLSGTVYPEGTTVRVSGRGSAVDAFVDGDWLPLAWWEFAEGIEEATEA